jgi:hypothetical protein
MGLEYIRRTRRQLLSLPASAWKMKKLDVVEVKRLKGVGGAVLTNASTAEDHEIVAPSRKTDQNCLLEWVAGG